MSPHGLQIDAPSDLEPAGRLLASLGIGLTLVDRDMQVLWANPFVLEQAPELSCGGGHCFTALWQRDRVCADCLPSQVFRSGEASEGIRERGRPGEGPQAWRVRAIPVADASGKLAWVAECLTRLVALEPGMLSGSPAEAAGAAFVVVDRAERIVSWSPAASAIFGHGVGQALGKRIDLVVPPDRTVEERDVAARVARDGAVARFETERLARDGRLVPVALTASVVRDESGALVGRSYVIEDLSTVHGLRSRVAALDSLLAHLMRAAADAILSVDQNGVVTGWNRGATRLLGHQASEMVGRPLAEVVGAGPLLELMARLEADGSVPPRRMEWRDARGEAIPVEVSAARLPALDGAEAGAALVARDLTAQVRLDRQLMRSEKLAMVGSMAAGLAHEIGTPLNVISATAEYLLMGGTGEEDRRLKEIVAETERISRLVREILTFARGTNPGRATLRVSDVVARALRLTGIAMDKKQIRVACDVPLDLPPIQADQDGVHQVLLNLLMNAAQSVAEGGRIEVRARLEDGAGQPLVALEVDDDGPGVPPELRERVFDPFFTTRTDGTGLGLAVCARIVADHGGDIRVGEAALGGAAFVVQLPAAGAELVQLGDAKVVAP